MSIQPVHRHEPDTSRIQHTIGGISDAPIAERAAQWHTVNAAPKWLPRASAL